MMRVRGDMEATHQERDEIDAMHEALRRIAAEVISDADQSLLDDSGDPELSTKVLRPDSPIRYNTSYLLGYIFKFDFS